MFSTSITNGDFDTFFINAKNSVLILFKKKNHEKNNMKLSRFNMKLLEAFGLRNKKITSGIFEFLPAADV